MEGKNPFNPNEEKPDSSSPPLPPKPEIPSGEDSPPRPEPPAPGSGAPEGVPAGAPRVPVPPALKPEAEETQKIPAKPGISAPPQLPPPAPNRGMAGIAQQEAASRISLESEADRQEQRDHDRKLLLIGAGIALVIALITGYFLNTMISPKVGTSNIEDQSITSPKIGDGAVTKEKLAPNSIDTGPTGPTGRPGATGPAGKTGPTGPAAVGGGLTGVEFLTDTSPNNSAITKGFNLSCPAGKKIISGGSEIIGGNESVVLTASTPAENGRAWSARAIEVENFNQAWSIAISLTCATLQQKKPAAANNNAAGNNNR